MKNYVQQKDTHKSLLKIASLKHKYQGYIEYK